MNRGAKHCLTNTQQVHVSSIHNHLCVESNKSFQCVTRGTNTAHAPWPYHHRQGVPLIKPYSQFWFRSHVARWALVSAFSVAGCGLEDAPASLDDPELDQTTQDVVGGTVTSLRPEVGMLQTATARCTATLIGDRHILTAAHCINYAAQARGNKFVINFGTATERAFTIDRLFSQVEAGVNNRDLAIGRLTTPVPRDLAAPAAISKTQPTKGAVVTVIGYGCTERGTSPWPFTKRFKTYRYGSETFNACAGDSGGPTFTGNLRAGGSVVGVTSGYRDADQNFRDVAGDPVLHRPHITGMVSAMEAAGVSYRALDKTEWLPAITNGVVTEARNGFLTSFQVWSATPGVRLCYSVKTPDFGWSPEACDGDMVGSLPGIALPSAEPVSVRIRLAAPGPFSSVRYRVRRPIVGWQDWKKNNEEAGGTPVFKPTDTPAGIEAIAIEVR